MLTPETTPVVQDHLTTFVAALAPLAIAITSFLNHRKGKHRDANSGSALKRIEGKLDDSIDEQRQINERLTQAIRDVSHLVVGPLGDNGVRGDLRELKSSLDRHLDEHRDADREMRLHGPYNRGTG
jgi:hypothetical protein